MSGADSVRGGDLSCPEQVAGRLGSSARGPRPLCRRHQVRLERHVGGIRRQRTMAQGLIGWQRRRGRGVQRLANARRQVLVDRDLLQGMHERQLRRARRVRHLDQRADRGGGEDIEDGGDPRHLLHDGDRRPTTQDRQRLADRRRRARQRGHLGCDDRAERAGDGQVRSGAGELGRRELLEQGPNVERVPRGVAGEARRRLRRKVGPRRGRELRALLPGERRDHDPLAAIGIGVEAAPPLVTGPIVVADGRHHQDPIVVEAPQSRDQRLQGRLIGPVEVLDRQHRHPSALLELGEVVDQPQGRGEGGGVGGPDHRAEQAHRHVHGQFVAVGPLDHETVVQRVEARPHQRRLPRPCGPLDGHEPRVPRRRVARRRGEPPLLDRSSDEGHRCRHREPPPGTTRAAGTGFEVHPDLRQGPNPATSRLDSTRRSRPKRRCWADACRQTTAGARAGFLGSARPAARRSRGLPQCSRRPDRGPSRHRRPQHPNGTRPIRPRPHHLEDEP